VPGLAGHAAQANLAMRRSRHDDVLGLNALSSSRICAGIAETGAALPHLQALPQHEGRKQTRI